MQYPFSKFTKTMALIWAILVFVTSVGVSVDMHFCQDKLKSYSFFGKAKNCHELAAQPVGCKHHPKLPQQHRIKKKACCSNKSVVYQLDQDKQILDVDIIDIAKEQLFVYCRGSKVLWEVQENLSLDKFLYYKPPLLRKNIPVLIQSFLL